MDLKTLVKEVKAKREYALQDPGVDPRTRGVKLGKIRQAKEQLKQLMETYKGEVRRRIVFILPSGPGAETFHTIATGEDFGYFSGDGEGIYKDTIKNVNPRLYENNPFSPDMLTTVSNYFQEVADEIGIMSYPQMIFKNRWARTLKSKEDLMQSVKIAINEEIGVEIVGYHILHYVAQQALEENFSGKIVPVIVKCADEALHQELANKLRKVSPHVFTVETKEEVTDKHVEKELKDVRKQMKTAIA